jgi:hypothetical protein
MNYRYANYVIKNFIEKYGVESLKKTLSLMKGKLGTNQELTAAIRAATGDDSIQLSEIVYPTGE